jgi:ATP-dependent DNA helicase RecQ
MPSSFSFSSLQSMLANWPQIRDIDSPASDGLLERARKALLLWRDHSVPLSPPDVTALLRQIILRERMHGKPADLKVPATQGWPTQALWRTSGVQATPVGALAFHLSVELPRLDFIGVGRDLYDDAYGEVQSRVDARVAADPFIEQAIAYRHYTCVGQREAVRALFLMPFGHSLIANLPTGSGKSLLAQAPILCEGWEGRLTVVVVPTIGLALDQARRMKPLLERRFPKRAWSALAYHGGLSDPEKQAIRAAIRAGRQGIVFASPESVGSGLASALNDAVESGFLHYLIIDEAHLVGSWGDGFRPGFQALSGIRRALLKKAPRQPFKTVLASATLTEEVIDLLRHLFGPAEHTQVIASVHLRPEPRYWYHRASNETERDALVLEAIAKAPRPLILYATTRDEVTRWWSILTRLGHSRVAPFHGGTSASERERILQQWSEGELDIVVANSAFGLGVDKHDVRTVIHATIPEGLDRFYQEVGRGGRDGLACASLTIWVEEDVAQAASLASTKLIGDELGFDRWSQLVRSSGSAGAATGILTLNLDCLLPHLEQESVRNRSWNLHTVLLVARAGLIELVSGTADAAPEGKEGAFTSSCRVSILDPGHADKASWKRAVAASRANTRARVDHFNLLFHVLNRRREISESIAELYTATLSGASVSVTPCCGGCPAHWGDRRESAGHRPPSASVATTIVDVDTGPWLSRLPIADRHRLLVFYDALQFDSPSVVRAIQAILRSCPIQEMVLEGESSAKFQDNVRTVVAGLRRPLFMEYLGLNPPPSYQFRANTVRLTVVSPGTPYPACLGESGYRSQYAVILLPQGQADPFHPLRRYKATTTHHMDLEALLEVLTE